MFDFLQLRISTIAGFIFIFLIIGVFGAVIFWQFYQLMNIRFETIELKTLEKPMEESLPGPN